MAARLVGRPGPEAGRRERFLWLAFFGGALAILVLRLFPGLAGDVVLRLGTRAVARVFMGGGEDASQPLQAAVDALDVRQAATSVPVSTAERLAALDPVQAWDTTVLVPPCSSGEEILGSAPPDAPIEGFWMRRCIASLEGAPRDGYRGIHAFADGSLVGRAHGRLWFQGACVLTRPVDRWPTIPVAPCRTDALPSVRCPGRHRPCCP
ncbi:MAG: hypothetical protein FJ296_04965 [Planctomycetes bacterium]|nr:hypothetical protein [Planctomycetota bacterium]